MLIGVVIIRGNLLPPPPTSWKQCLLPMFGQLEYAIGKILGIFEQMHAYLLAVSVAIYALKSPYNNTCADWGNFRKKSLYESLLVDLNS